MFPCMKEIKYDKCTCLLEMNCKFTKIRLRYYFSSIPSKVMDKYGQAEIETKHLKVVSHFISICFFFWIHSITTFSLVDTKRQTGTVKVVKEKIVLKVHCSWQNGENVNFPLIQNLSLFALQWHIKPISHSKFNKNKLDNRFLNVNRFDFHLSTFSGVTVTLPLIPHHTSPSVGVWAFIIEAV